MSGKRPICFRLYIAGDTPNSALAQKNLHDLCNAHLPGRHEIEVVDVFREPQRARADHVMFTPTLIKFGSSPATVTGTLSNTPRVLHILQLQDSDGVPPAVLQEAGAKVGMSQLIESLHKTGRRLEELTGGEVDSVLSSDGKTFVLQHAQARIRTHEAQRRAAILDALPASIALLNSVGAIVSVNATWRQFADQNELRSPNFGIGSNYLGICAASQGEGASDARQAEAGLRAVLGGKMSSFSLEYPCHSATQQRWFLMMVTPLSADSLSGVVVMHLNISERKQAEARIIDSEMRLRKRVRQQGLVAAFGQYALMNADLDQLFRQALLFVRDGLEIDHCRVIELADNPDLAVVKAVLGWSEAWRGRCISVGAGANAYRPFARAMAGNAVSVNESVRQSSTSAEMLAERQLVSCAEVLITGMGGTYGLLSAYSQKQQYFCPDDVNYLQSVANMLEAAIDRMRAETRLSYMAQFDVLTGLPNRKQFSDRLSHALIQAQRGTRRIAVLFVDLDGFKTVNDTLGHKIGDLLLQQVAARLQGVLRESDTVSRHGGDEFVIVLSEIARTDDAGFVAEKIMSACTQPFLIDGAECFTSASIGIALFPEDGSDAEKLLDNADKAMYRAKEQGRSRYQYYLPEMHEQAIKRMHFERELRGALEREEFLLHFQPKADLRSGAICGLEALLRWQHPEKGLIYPADFIPILEDTGLIDHVGAWVIRTVCQQLAQWQSAGLNPPATAVNISARQFHRTDLDQMISTILEEAQVKPALLELELTESMLMKDAEEAAHILRKLKQRGIRLAIDDFGTGYSSLAYLKRFPIDVLKIDRTFVRDCTTDPEDAAIALAVIHLARSLKLTVVAEGVETVKQLNFLGTHGCDHVQGFYFSRPLDAAAMTSALVNGLRLQLPVMHARGDRPVLLLVDDNRVDLELFSAALAEDGYRILTAPDASTGLDILAGEHIDIVISDQRMRPMAGVPFLTAVRNLYPEAVRVLMTGSKDGEALPEAVNRAGIHKFLSKHWDHERLRSAVRDICRTLIEEVEVEA